MKKQTQTNKKLRLDATKIRVLTPSDLDTVVGGAVPTKMMCEATVPTRCC